MRMLTFARRCAREMLRDPLNLAFGLGFPLVLLVLLSAIQANIPVSLFEIDNLITTFVHCKYLPFLILSCCYAVYRFKR